MIIPTQATLTQYDLAVSLPRYFKIVQIKECAGFGVNNSDDPELGCRTIWTKSQRDWLARYLAEAQEEIEQVTGFPLTQRWFANERQPFSNPVQAKWGKVISGGIRGESDISLGEVIDQTSDPAVIGPVATTVTDEAEIFVYHPGTDIEIIPSSVTISGGFVTIEVPRCRTVTQAANDNDSAGLQYNDLTNFETTVDIKRVYNDNSVNAELVWLHSCTVACSTNGCSEKTQSACIYVNFSEVGSLNIQPANYSGGSWNARSICYNGLPELVRLNYRAGIEPTLQMEEAVIRLAHSKMPSDFCSSCDTFSRFHKRDNIVPDVLTKERLNCPFGLSNGAWIAWTFAKQFKMVRGYTF